MNKRTNTIKTIAGEAGRTVHGVRSLCRTVDGAGLTSLRRLAALAMLLLSFAVSAEAETTYYYCQQCPKEETLLFSLSSNGDIEIYRDAKAISYMFECTWSIFTIYGRCLRGHRFSYEIGPVPHDWGDATHIADATCTTVGYDEHTCTRCKTTERCNEVAALGHDWGATFGDLVAPTCTTAGGYYHTCQRDGCGVTELDNTVAALGHEWTEWTETTAATCTTAAVEARHCQRNGCDANETRNVGDPLGHTWGADYRCIRGDAELPAIAYVKADGTEGSHQAFPITGGDTDDVVLGFENADTWYYLSGKVHLHSLRLIDRTANIILTAGCNILTLVGINVENGSLNIYTQSSSGQLVSTINAHDDVNIYGGYVIAYNNGLSAGGDITLGWTNADGRIYADSYSAGGTITVAEGKALMNNSDNSEIFYGDGTPINAADIAGKRLVPKTDVLCYVGADDHAHFLNDGDYTVLTNETVINPESSPADAVQWLVVSGNVEFTGDLNLCGTTHLILLDDAVLTASSTSGYALYTERITNIYGSTKGNGRIEVTNGDLYCGGLLNIYGGDIRVSGSFKGRGTKNLSWTRGGNRFYAASYEGSAVRIAAGKLFIDEDGVVHTSDRVGTLASKTLRPFIPEAGDANRDGRVTVTDAVLVLDYVRTHSAPAGFSVAEADADGSGNVTEADAVEILCTVIGAQFIRTVKLSTLEDDFVAQDGDVLTGSLAGNHKISIASGATVTLDGVTINGVNDESCSWAGITCLGDATIILKGSNTVKGFFEEYPGIQPGPTNTKFTILGAGSLTASSNGRGSGIGSACDGECGIIEISGGEITAYGGDGAAGIGRADNSDCDGIKISGGKVTATGGEYGAGIGSGEGRCNFFSIEISGGEVTAYGGRLAAGIGSGGEGRCAKISISGGKVTATGGGSGAGIGSGGSEGTCGDIEISAGEVTATGGRWAAGIGSGYNYSNCGTITIKAGVTSVTATKGSEAPNSIGAGADSSCGSVNIEDGATVTEN